MHDLRIDPEFRDKIPPLTEAEFQQLRENIIQDGEVYEPICVWNGTIVDGHNRWKIIQEYPEIPYRIKEMNFADKWEAAEWMYRKQLGRRNLTDEQKTYMIGKMYEARKQAHGGQIPRSRQNDDTLKGRTSEQIANELNIGRKTVERSEKFAKGVDALKENNPEAAEMVLCGGSGVTKQEISDLPKKTEEEQQEFAEAIVSGALKQRTQSHGYTREMRERDKLVNAVVSDMYSTEIKPFTIEMLEGDIETNGQNYIEMLRSTLTDRSTLLVGDNRKRVAAKIDHIIEEIKKIRGLIE